MEVDGAVEWAAERQGIGDPDVEANARRRLRHPGGIRTGVEDTGEVGAVEVPRNELQRVGSAGRGKPELDRRVSGGCHDIGNEADLFLQWRYAALRIGPGSAGGLETHE